MQVLKPVNDIKEMEDDCEDVYTTGLLQRYAKRPFSLEHLTLEDWAHMVWLFQKDADNLPLETANDENDDELCDENNCH